MTPLRYEVKTRVFANGEIQLELTKNADIIARWVMNTREKSIRAALIQLGWTPPKEPES